MVRMYGLENEWRGKGKVESARGMSVLVLFIDVSKPLRYCIGQFSSAMSRLCMGSKFPRI